MIALAVLRNLIGKIANDDVAAYKELYLLYYDRLLRFSTSITHSKELAEEVVSDVFFKIWTKRKSLVTVVNFHLYIYISTKNYSINELLKQKKIKTFSLDETVAEIESIYLSPEQVMITAEMIKRITEAIGELPPRCRMIFKLVKEDGLKYKEVAELLNLSIKTIESQMSIALRKVHQSIRFDMERTIPTH